MNTGPVDPQIVADKFLYAFNIMAREGHSELARKLSGICRATRESDNLWDDINYAAFKAEKTCSPLSYAISKGDTVRAEFLLKHCADNVFYGPRNTVTPLLQAICNGDVDMIILLINYGAPVNYTGPYTPLYVAAKYDNAAVAATLLDRGAKIDTPDGGGYTPLMVACEHHNMAVVNLLCKRGASTEVTDKYGHTVLMQAIHDNHGTILEELCRLGANVNGVNSRGSTPLLEACKGRGNYHAVDTLCYYGANVNAVDEDGWTPLMYATQNQNLGVLNVLLSCEAEVNYMNNLGESAMRIARSRRRRWRDNEDNDDDREEIVATLAEFGALYNL